MNKQNIPTSTTERYNKTTKISSLTAKVSKEYRKLYKGGVTQARIQEIAGAWLIEQS